MIYMTFSDVMIARNVKVYTTTVLVVLSIYNICAKTIFMPLH